MNNLYTASIKDKEIIEELQNEINNLKTELANYKKTEKPEEPNVTLLDTKIYIQNATIDLIDLIEQKEPVEPIKPKPYVSHGGSSSSFKIYPNKHLEWQKNMA